MFAMMAASMGESMSPKDCQRSECGEQFDEYVFRELDLFPWSLVGAGSREVNDLWDGRRLKVHYNGSWREGKVCGWRQFNPDASTTETKWSMKLELDSFEVGDVVNMSVSGTICNHDKGACVIKVPHEEGAKDVAIKPAQVDLPRMKFDVNRINLVGGGTLKVMEHEDAPLISLEWLEPPSPSIRLNTSILSFDCPCCRSAEPMLVACGAPALTKKDDCPVCLETKDCQVLECGHGVCQECWSSCRQTAMYGSIELDDLDAEEVQKERAERYRLYKKKRTRSYGGDDAAKRRFAATIAEIAREARDGDSQQGLVRLKRELMVEHPSLWASDGTDFYGQLPISGLKIAIQVIEERMDEIQAALTGHAHEMTYFLCFMIARRYSEAKNYLAAVPWAELSLFYTKRVANDDKQHLSTAHRFAAQMQRNADFFSKSMENYDASLVISENFRARQERQSLLHQMEQWTGSSGKLTPGC
jgi:hypothetical protein